MSDLPPPPAAGDDEPGAAADLPPLGGGFSSPPPGPPAGPPTGPPIGSGPYPPGPYPPGPYPPGPSPGTPVGLTAPPGTGASTGLAVGALVCGIVGITTFWLCGLGAIPGVTAVVLGGVALTTAKRRDDRQGRGMAIGGIVTGAIAVVASIGFVAAIGFSSNPGPNVDTAPGTGPATTSAGTEYQGGLNTDPRDGTCDQDRFLQDPDCEGEMFTGGLNSDTPDGTCDQDRFMQDPDC